MAPEFHFDNLDAAENTYFARSLEVVKAGSYDVKYPNLLARTLIPLDSSVPPGAETITYRQYDQVGVAKIIGNYGRELPRADVKGKEFHSTVKTMGVAYGYTTQEVRNAAYAGTPLDARKAAAARRAFEELVEKIAANGDATNNLGGFLNITNAQTLSPGTGGVGTPNTAWSLNSSASASTKATGTPGTNGLLKTNDKILADLHNACQTMIDATQGLEVPDTILMPLSQFGVLTTTPRSDNSDTTLLSFFLSNHPYIKNVSYWLPLKNAGTNGVDRIVIYRRDPSALSLVVPMEFTQHAPQQRGLEFEVPCEGRIGGVIAYYPMSVGYMDGV